MIYILKKIMPALLVGILGIGVYFYFFPSEMLNIKERFFGPATIEDTGVILEDIENIAELVTVDYLCQVATDTSRTTREDLIDKSLQLVEKLTQTPIDYKRMQSFVIITTGHVRAGFDLSTLQIQHTDASTHSIEMTIAPPVILDIITNPNDIQIFVEQGRWPEECKQDLIMKAREKIRQKAEETEILKQAEKQGEKALQDFFMLLGFEQVKITIETLKEDKQE